MDRFFEVVEAISDMVGPQPVDRFLAAVERVLAPARPVVALDVDHRDALSRAQAGRIGEANAQPASDTDRPPDGGQPPR